MNEMENQREAGMELNMMDLLAACLKKWKLIVLCTALAATIALAVTYYFVTPMYQASITIYVNNTNVVEDKDHLTSADLSASIYLVKGYMTVAKSDSVLEKVAEKLDGKYSVEQLRGTISTEQVEDTMIFRLYVLYTDPVEAARIANALAEVAPTEISTVIEGTSARVVDTAKVPTKCYSPSYSRNAVVGAVVGLLLSVVYVTIVYLRDTRINDENDLTDIFEFPILGRIPDFDDERSTGTYGNRTEQG